MPAIAARNYRNCRLLLGRPAAPRRLEVAARQIRDTNAIGRHGNVEIGVSIVRGPTAPTQSSSRYGPEQAVDLPQYLVLRRQKNRSTGVEIPEMLPACRMNMMIP